MSFGLRHMGTSKNLLLFPPPGEKSRLFAGEAVSRVCFFSLAAGIRVFRGALIFIIILMPMYASAYTWHLSRFERGPLPEISPPRAHVHVLGGSLRCYLLEDHTLPLVKVRVIARTGSIYDPPDKVGLAILSAMLMRSGGAGKLSPEEFDAALDDLGAKLSLDADHEMLEASLEVLSQDVKSGMVLLFDMLTSPRLDAGRLKVAKGKLIEALRREDDDPATLAAYRFRQLVYGKESPWARRPTPESIADIGVEDVKAFHERYFRAGNFIVAFAGDFKSREMLNLIETLSDSLPGGSVQLPHVPAVDYKFAPAYEEVHRKTSQAFMRIGHLSIKRDNPDKFPLFLVNEILGAGAFKSRLVDDVRTRRGLAYSVWSKLTPGADYGLFVIGANTKANQSGEVLELVRRHLERIAKDGDIAEGELEYARRSVLTGLVFEFDSAFKVVDNLARFHFYGYPDDYWRVYRTGVASVTPEDIRRVSREYLHPEGLKVLIVGP